MSHLTFSIEGSDSLADVLCLPADADDFNPDPFISLDSGDDGTGASEYIRHDLSSQSVFATTRA